MSNASLLLLFMLLCTSTNSEKHKFQSSISNKLNVKDCPEMPIMKNVDKKKLLGVWYAYATTPLPFRRYQRRCASYNVKDSPYFETNILYTNYDSLAITYACNFNPKLDTNQLKLRILTRTRTPMSSTVHEAANYLVSIKFPIETLDWLKSDAFCFEWYQLKFETEMRPIKFQAPFNGPDD
ncbi:uncharacterized protein LOC117780569 [Drosophila innubila]|uniref:uncharacterized protein LOC117780569 n=1 Tax=Drosophila innubila TaxID=198719 RepID=UPI00148E2A45|nr:uncharacterized protein LOC117780569 [Drosophila innubila]